MISVIIPTYNRANFISETLDSLLTQSYENWECIIVDDGSTDRTPEIVEPFLEDSRFQFHHRPKNRPKGANACRNYGYQLSQGSFIKWFDSDDVLHPEALKVSLSYLLKGNDVVVFSLRYVDEQRNLLNKQHKFISENVIEDYLLGNISFFTGTPTWSRDFLEKQPQLFDEKLSNLDDWDFTLRMLYENPRIAFINKVLMDYRIHQDSLSSEISKLNFVELKSEIKARKKHLSLLTTNKKANPLIVENFLKTRYKFFVRETFVQRDKSRFYFLIKLMSLQLKLRDFYGFHRSIMGFLSFILFDKGYKFFK